MAQSSFSQIMRNKFSINVALSAYGSSYAASVLILSAHAVAVAALRQIPVAAVQFQDEETKGAVERTETVEKPCPYSLKLPYAFHQR